MLPFKKSSVRNYNWGGEQFNENSWQSTREREVQSTTWATCGKKKKSEFTTDRDEEVISNDMGRLGRKNA